MPANLTPQYMEAERRFKQASSVPEKIAALQEMMSIIPRHKGTEKLQADLKKKMAVLRQESEQKKTTGSRRDSLFAVEREGARQIALVGAPNAGKSQLVRALTHATPEVADYPYTTRAPIPGMMLVENARFQLVDLPPVSSEFMEPGVVQVVRNADAAFWVVDLSDDDLLEKFDETQRLMSEARIDLLSMKTLGVGSKLDAAGAAERLSLLEESVGGRIPITKLSAASATPEQLETFKRVVYDFLNVVRVYTKVPGKKADLTDPYVMDRGSTVLDVAEKVHRDFLERLKYAKIWGHGKPDGIMVPRDFVINEGDILELHE